MRQRRGAEEIRCGSNRFLIKIGNLMPYSGPASAYAAIGTASTTNAAGVDASRDIISAVYLRDNPTFLAKRERLYQGMRMAGVPEG
jgi:hypothetical protein